MLIVWFSRHRPTKRQRLALQSVFGASFKLHHDRCAFDGASEVVARFQAMKADEMVIVAPLSVISAITKLGIHPLWARMEQCGPKHPQREVTIKDRYYRFVQFERIIGLNLDTVPLTPNHEKEAAHV